jgi:hypothetical protein
MEFEREQILKRLSDSGKYQTEICASEDLEKMTFRIRIRQLLWENPILIEFEKADGTIRVIECTLSYEHGAKHSAVEVVETGTLGMFSTLSYKPSNKKINPDICTVWDIKKSAWRSFRWDRIKKIDYRVD